MSKSTYSGVAKHPQSNKRYTSDSTDKEWMIIAPELAQAEGPGRKRTVNLREIVNAIFYRTRTGCQWRMLPKEFPDWHHVWYYYKKWTSDGTWERLTDRLRRLSLAWLFWTVRPSKRPKRAANGALMATRKSRDANDISWWTALVCYWSWWFTLPIFKIMMALVRCYNKPRPNRAAYKRSLLMGSTPRMVWSSGSNSSFALSLKSSPVIKANKGLWSCPNAGLWNEPSLG